MLLVLVFHFSARGPSGLMVRSSDWYSEGLGFDSQLDPGFFFPMDLFLTLSTKTSSYVCFLCQFLVQFNV